MVILAEGRVFDGSQWVRPLTYKRSSSVWLSPTPEVGFLCSWNFNDGVQGWAPDIFATSLEWHPNGHLQITGDPATSIGFSKYAWAGVDNPNPAGGTGIPSVPLKARYMWRVDLLGGSGQQLLNFTYDDQMADSAVNKTTVPIVGTTDWQWTETPLRHPPDHGWSYLTVHLDNYVPWGDPSNSQFRLYVDQVELTDAANNVVWDVSNVGVRPHVWDGTRWIEFT